MLRISAFLICLFCATVWLTAQTTETGTQSAEDMLKAITGLLDPIKRPEAKDAADGMTALFKEGAIDSAAISRVYLTTTQLTAQRYKPYPEITQYVQAIVAAYNHPEGGTRFSTWQQFIERLLLEGTVGRKEVADFLEFSVHFLENNLLFTSNTRQWRAEDDYFNYDVADGKAIVRFQAVSLTGETAGDQLHIYESEGTYSPTDKLWTGTRGLIRWEGTALDPQTTFARFGYFQVNFQQSEFRIDSASLNYGILFQSAIAGTLTHKLRINVSEATSGYPIFESYDKRIRIPQVARGVDFEGSFRLRGDEVEGYGTAEDKAVLVFQDNSGRVQLKTLAENYSIKANSISSSRADMVLYFGTDSITHPGIVLRYLVDDRQLIATKGQTGIGKAPFTDSYHDLEMNPERLVWDMDEPTIQMAMLVAGARTPANFYSTDFFDFDLYDSYRGVLSYNPIQQLFKLKQGYGTDVIRAEIVAKAFNPGISVPQAEGLFYQLVADGFIQYNAELQEVTILDKVDRYELASRRAIDHDHIRLKSETDTINATLNLITGELALNGIYSTTLNAKHFVHAFPGGGAVTVTENRDMTFGGTLFAGMLDFYGKDLFFNYDRYDVTLREIDSLVIYKQTDSLDEFGEPVLEPLRTVFEGIQGTILLDQPFNKAGYQDFPDYPKFITDSASYAYYDKGTGLDSAYNRDEFYFRIDPFEIDSLGTFTFESQTFTGMFHSGGIFPDLYQDLMLRNDNSLGFIYQTPEEGLPIYGGLGQYHQTIDLSNRGLRGNGTIDYLNANLTSADFLFMTDSTKALLNRLDMRKMVIDTVYFPAVQGDSIFMKWVPGQDSLLLVQDETPFRLFDQEVAMKGMLNLRSTGVTGSGLIDWAQADVRSKDYSFGSTSFRADTAGVRIKSADDTKPALRLDNANVSIDFDRNSGFITNNRDSIPVELPFNLYQTNMDRYRWNMSDSLIVFEPGFDDEYAWFLSMHRGQDSLRYLSKRAVYNLRDYSLKVEQIPYIPVADCHVIPDQNTIVVLDGAKVQTLEKASILIDSSRQDFRIVDATLSILGRNDMRGEGFYDYVNRSGIAQRIPMQTIGVFNRSRNDTIYTFAEGVILDSLQFNLDPQISYKGRVNIDSRDSMLQFDGVARIKIADPTKVTATWFKMEQPIEPTNVVIQAEEMVGPERESVYSGIHKRADSTDLYTTITGRKINYIDNSIFLAEGQLRYDDGTSTYTVAPATFFDKGFSLGNVMQYNNASGDIYGEGTSTLDLDLGMCQLMISGDITKKAGDSLYRFDAMVSFDFYITDIIKDLMFRDLQDISFNGRDIDPLAAEFQRDFTRLIGDTAAAAEVYANLNRTGILSYPKKETPPMLLLSDMQFWWDEATSSFLSVGKAGLVMVNGQYIGKTMTVYMELGYRRSEDYVNLYIAGRDEWHFINYQNKRVNIITSNVNINSNVINTKVKERSIREGSETISFTIATEFAKERFFQTMKYLEDELKKQGR